MITRNTRCHVMTDGSLHNSRRCKHDDLKIGVSFILPLCKERKHLLHGYQNAAKRANCLCRYSVMTLPHAIGVFANVFPG